MMRPETTSAHARRRISGVCGRAFTVLALCSVASVQAQLGFGRGGGGAMGGGMAGALGGAGAEDSGGMGGGMAGALGGGGGGGGMGGGMGGAGSDEMMRMLQQMQAQQAQAGQVQATGGARGGMSGEMGGGAIGGGMGGGLGGMGMAGQGGQGAGTPAGMASEEAGSGGDFAQMLQMFQQQAAQQMQGGARAGAGGMGALGGIAEPEASGAAGGAFAGFGMQGAGKGAGAGAGAGRQQQEQRKGGGGGGAGMTGGATGSAAAGGDPLLAYYNQRCQQKHGPNAEYDEESTSCVCAEGFGPDDSEQCVAEDGAVEENVSAGGGAAAAAAAAQAAAQAQAQKTAQAGGASGGKNANAWFSQMFGGAKGGKGGSSGAEEDTCPGGVCKHPPAKYQGAGSGAASMPGPAIVKVDHLCKQVLGRGAEFDGIDSCRCSAGHAHKGGQCVSELPGGASATAAGGSSRQGTAAAGGIKQQDAAFERYNQMCKGDHGPYAEFDGVDSCKCMEGYEDVGGKCVRAGTAGGGSGGAGAQHPAAAAKAAEKAKYDKMCQAQYPNSMYDGMSECVCQEGFVEVEGQGCVPAGRSGVAGGAGAGGKGSAASGADPNQKHHVTCQQMFGPNAQFDGVDSCECKDGFSQGADGKCAPDAPASQAATTGGRARPAEFAEFDAQCAQMVPNSEFDGVSDCRCKQGFNQVGNSCVPAGGAAGGGAWGNAAAAPHAAGAAGAAAGAGQLSAVQVEQYNQQCQELKGPYWVFDGVDDCTCAPGAQRVGNDCRPAGGAQAGAAAGRGGAGAWGGAATAGAGAGGAGGRGAAAGAAGASAGAMAGWGAGAQEESLKDRNDKLCRERFGAGAEFDGSDGCRCQRGFTNINGVCTPAGGAAQGGARGFGGY